MKRAARSDKNQIAIVKALRKVGASVLHLHRLGQGAPDILVGLAGKNYLFELKANLKSSMTPMEKDFFFRWRGQVHVAFCAEDILRVTQA